MIVPDLCVIIATSLYRKRIIYIIFYSIRLVLVASPERILIRGAHLYIPNTHTRTRIRTLVHWWVTYRTSYSSIPIYTNNKYLNDYNILKSEKMCFDIKHSFCFNEII